MVEGEEESWSRVYHNDRRYWYWQGRKGGNTKSRVGEGDSQEPKGELRMTEAEGEGEGRGGGRGDDTGSRRGEEMGVTSQLQRGEGACRLP